MLRTVLIFEEALENGHSTFVYNGIFFCLRTNDLVDSAWWWSGDLHISFWLRSTCWVRKIYFGFEWTTFLVVLIFCISYKMWTDGMKLSPYNYTLEANISIMEQGHRDRISSWSSFTHWTTSYHEEIRLDIRSWRKSSRSLCLWNGMWSPRMCLWITSFAAVCNRALPIPNEGACQS